MRYPESHKEEVRARIVEGASRALRKSGIGGVSIPALMKKAGLTHGGFYNHFDGRDDLVAAAIRDAAQRTSAGTFGDERDLASVVEAYLSPAHVAHPEGGCVLAALGTEALHQPAPVRRAFAETARGFLRLLERKRSPRSARSEPSDETLAIGAQLIGAVVLARLVGDPRQGARILAAARRAALERA